MIFCQTWLKVIDNSGVRDVECVLTSKHGATAGRIVPVVVKQIRRKRAFELRKLNFLKKSGLSAASKNQMLFVPKARRGTISLGIIARLRKEQNYADGSSSQFERNFVILINRKNRLLGTRVFGFRSRKLRNKKFLRILLLANKLIR